MSLLNILKAVIKKKRTQIIINVKDFGALGDGVTDDYDALQAAAAAINAQGGGMLFFPPGTYQIDRYIISGGPNQNTQTVKHIQFKNCNGLKIIGYGAKIDVKGDFHKSRDFQSGGYWISYAHCITPFMIIGCTNFSIEGLEINGNADQTTRDPDVIEGFGHGIWTSNCSNISFVDCEFRGNIGSQFIATVKTQNIHVDRCRIVAEDYSYFLAVTLAGVNGKITSSFIDAGVGYVHANFGVEGRLSKIIDCEIRSSNFGIVSDTHQDLLIERCRIIGTFTTTAINMYQPYLKNNKCHFIDNYIFRPGVAYESPDQTYAIGCIVEVQYSKGNSFDTDLVPQDEEHFCTAYSPDTITDNDWYVAKESRAFRPRPNDTRDNSLPFSYGLNNLGGAIIGDKKHYYGYTAPTSGSWNQGDIVYNTLPKAGKNIGWVCVATGAPGTWKEFGSIKN